MLSQKIKNHQIILASGSPRRQQFFKEMDLDFIVQVREVDEVFPTHLKGAEITDYLAQLKAKAFDEDIKNNQIVITSDTLVLHENKVLGKPKNHKEAFEMLQSLSNATHQVITSVCIKTFDKTIVFNDTTHVTFKVLTPEMITYYIENYKPFDKAGSYGIQEWIGLIGITKIEGSYANVVGLPTQKVFDYFEQIKL